MPQLNLEAREITLKIVYYGPALSGKTTNLRQIHAKLAAGMRSEMVTLDTQDDRTLYFDFLPVEFGAEGDFKIKLKLFTVPGQVLHRSTRRVVLAGADAVVFVADSQRSASSGNAYSYRDLEANLRANGLDIHADADGGAVQQARPRGHQAARRDPQGLGGNRHPDHPGAPRRRARA